MKYPNCILIIGLSLLIITMILITGCTTSSQNQVTTTVQTPLPTTLPPSLTPIITVQTTTEPITIATTSINTTTIIIPQTPVKIENPYINNLQFKMGAFPGHIHNCEMEEIFPTFAKDPYYGLNQKIPKISAISAGEFNVFLRDYTEGKNENQKVMDIYRCEGKPVTPYWNFVRVDAKITPTNGNPTNYTVSINIKSGGKTIAQFNTTEKLTQNQIISFESYIPLKTDEMPLIDGVELTFTKLKN